MAINSFHHVKLDVEDLKRSLDFYCDGLGFEQIVRYERDDGVVIVQVSPDGVPPGIELWWEPPYRGLNDDRLHIALDVTDLDHTLGELERQGITVEEGPFRIGHEAIAFIRDPDGYLIELNEDTGSTSSA
jgi:lactoylglutathione lyase